VTMRRCPREQKIWRETDLSEVICPQCGRSVEFWQGDSERTCPACGRVVACSPTDAGADDDPQTT